MYADEQLEQEAKALVQMKQQVDRETIAKYRKLEAQLLARLRSVQAKLLEASTEDAPSVLRPQ